MTDPVDGSNLAALFSWLDSRDPASIADNFARTARMYAHDWPGGARTLRAFLDAAETLTVESKVAA